MMKKIVLVALFIIISACGAAEPAQDTTHDTNHAAQTENQAATTPDQEPVEEAPADTMPDEEMPAEDPSTVEEAPAEDTPVIKEEAPEQEPDTGSTTQPDEAIQLHTVEISDFAFSPAKLEIRAGDSIKFINRDAIKHTATADDGSFDTKLLGQDEEMIITFSNAGEFPYYCAPHPGMRGTVVVNK